MNLVLLAITPIVERIRKRWRAEDFAAPAGPLPVESVAPNPGKRQIFLFSLSVLLTALLGIFHITLAEAPPAEAATVPIQTCSGISSGSTGGGTVSLGRATASWSYTIPQLQTESVPHTVSFGDPHYGFGSDQGPKTHQHLKQVYRPWVISGSSAEVPLSDASVTPPAPGAPDTSSNLTSQTTYMRPNVGSPTATFGSSWWAGDIGLGGTSGGYTVGGFYGTPSYSYSSGVGSGSGTRQSDGASVSSSPPNYYDQGTIEAWSWSANWSITVRGSFNYYYITYIVIPDTSWDGGPGSYIASTGVATGSTSASTSGTVSGCTRALDRRASHLHSQAAQPSRQHRPLA